MDEREKKAIEKAKRRREENKKAKRIFLYLILAYVLANLLFFFIRPFSSPWRYYTQHPEPIQVTKQNDATMPLDEIVEILDAIDLSYNARKRTSNEEISLKAKRVVGYILFPASISIGISTFIGYIGPPNTKQDAFTVSVKKRYNHLAKLAISKGMTKNGYLFLEDASISKKKGDSFQSLRTTSNKL